MTSFNLFYSVLETFPIPDDVLERISLKYQDQPDSRVWKSLSANLHLKREFIIQHQDKLSSLPMQRLYLQDLRKMSKGELERLTLAYSDQDDGLDPYEKACHLTAAWSSYCNRKDIDLDFVEVNLKWVSWDNICANRAVPTEFFKRHLKKLCWFTLSANESVEEYFFVRHQECIHWDMMSTNSGMSEAFFRRFSEHIVWERACQNSAFSLNFIKENLDKINISDFIHHPNVTHAFIREHFGKFGLYELCSCEKVPLELIVARHGELDMEALTLRSDLSPKFVDDCFDLMMPYIMGTKYVNFETFREFMEADLSQSL